MTPGNYMIDLGERHELAVRRLAEHGPLTIWQVGASTVITQDFGKDGFSVYTPTPNSLLETEDAILKRAL